MEISINARENQDKASRQIIQHDMTSSQILGDGLTVEHIGRSRKTRNCFSPFVFFLSFFFITFLVINVYIITFWHKFLSASIHFSLFWYSVFSSHLRLLLFFFISLLFPPPTLSLSLNLYAIFFLLYLPYLIATTFLLLLSSFPLTTHIEPFSLRHIFISSLFVISLFLYFYQFLCYQILHNYFLT